MGGHRLLRARLPLGRWFPRLAVVLLVVTTAALIVANRHDDVLG